MPVWEKLKPTELYMWYAYVNLPIYAYDRKLRQYIMSVK